MADTPIETLAADDIKSLRDLISMQLRMHRENLADRAKDREAVMKELKAQREEFMALVSKLGDQHADLKSRFESDSMLLSFVAGDGAEGNQGWIGELRRQVEQLKQFRWQIIAVVTTLVLVWDKVSPFLRGGH